MKELSTATIPYSCTECQRLSWTGGHSGCYKDICHQCSPWESLWVTAYLHKSCIFALNNIATVCIVLQERTSNCRSGWMWTSERKPCGMIRAHSQTYGLYLQWNPMQRCFAIILHRVVSLVIQHVLTANAWTERQCWWIWKFKLCL